MDKIAEILSILILFCFGFLAGTATHSKFGNLENYKLKTK